jgi:hypothetical protein
MAQSKSEIDKLMQQKYDYMVKEANIQQSAKVLDNPEQIVETPEKEFWKLAERNNNELLEKIRSENRMIKDVIVKMQEVIKNQVNGTVDALLKMEKINRRGELKEELISLAKKCEVSEDVDQIRLILP